jgi:hypothetical protein
LQDSPLSKEEFELAVAVSLAVLLAVLLVVSLAFLCYYTLCENDYDLFVD